MSKQSIGSDNNLNYLDSDEIQTSPQLFTSKYEQVLLNNTTRP